MLEYGMTVEWMIKNKAWWANVLDQYRIYGQSIVFVYNCPVKFK